MLFTSPESLRINAEKSFALASLLFPKKKWEPYEEEIFVAESRLLQEKGSQENGNAKCRRLGF